MGKMSRKPVAVQKLSSKTGNICMYSVLYPDSNLDRFSGMVPETLRIPFEDILGECEIPIPSICKC